jgi:carboxyl-terminal processing protease
VPLAVLVNQNSASASEIVAGAIKHLDRGVVIGETTFGKGSVQMLFDINAPVKLGQKSDDDKLGLKLTTAQYLTAGDISIQGVGVTPDIEMVSLNVQKHDDEAFIRLQPSVHRRQESDYEWHLDNPTASKAQKPFETISYLFQPPPGWEKRLREQDDEAGDDEDEAEDDPLDESQTKADYLMEFARDFLAQAKSNRRREMIQQSKAFFDKVRAEEDHKIAQALEKQLAVDWAQAPGTPAPGSVEVSLAAVGGKAKVAAGDAVKIRGTVKNLGTTPVYRVRAVLRSENTLFDENEMVFGKIGPGDTKTYDLTVHVPKSMPTRSDSIRAEVSAQNPLKLSGTEMALDIEGKPHPLFAYTYQTVDDLSGNRDGRVQRGEKVRTLVKVKNIGSGAALKPQAILRNGSGQEGIVISKGRFEGNELKPGGVWTISFEYDVGADFHGDDYVVELAVADKVFGESLADKIHIKVAPSGAAPDAASGTASVGKPEIVVREAPQDGALVLGRVKKGSSFKITGRSGNYYRVEIEENHPAFVSVTDVTTGGGAAVASAGSFAPEWQVTPPVLAVSAPTVVSGPSVRVKGTATDDHEVRDLFVRVWNRDAKMPPKKVFYLPNRTGDRKKLSFETDIPLWPGSNLVQVFARETNEVQSLQTLIVRRGSPSLAATSPSGKPQAEATR